MEIHGKHISVFLSSSSLRPPLIDALELEQAIRLKVLTAIKVAKSPLFTKNALLLLQNSPSSNIGRWGWGTTLSKSRLGLWSNNPFIVENELASHQLDVFGLFSQVIDSLAFYYRQLEAETQLAIYYVIVYAARVSLRQDALKDKFSPLKLFPRSLHPIESAA